MSDSFQNSQGEYMDFIYLVQGKRDAVLSYASLVSSRAKVFLLAYDMPFEAKPPMGVTTFYCPNTTWAEGRNILLESALNESFDYLIFLDDDVKIARGSFLEFENQLIKYKPSVGLPLCNEIKRTNRYLRNEDIQRPVALDQLVQAYSFETVRESVVLPFVTEFDYSSWWMSCEINAFLILRYYFESTLQFNNFEVLNTNHAWEEGISPTESIYVGGMSARQRLELRDYITNKFGKQPSISGTLFHPKYLPNIVYSLPFSEVLDNFRYSKDLRSFLRSVKQAYLFCKAKLFVFINWSMNSKNLLQPRIRVSTPIN